MSASKTVLRNTIFSYGRTLIAAALTLFSSRWVLADLGASDYGIYGLAGGLLFFVSFISSILSQGTSRYLAYATGSGSSEEVTKWFNSALNVFVCLPFVLIPIGLCVGELLVRFVLKIEPTRIASALWVFRCSLISFFAVLVATPFLSLLTSKQKIHIAASLMLVHSLGLFAIAWFLPYLPGDHLVAYAMLVAISFIFLQVLYILVCRRICPEARIRFSYWWDKDRTKALVGFSGWLCVGTIGTVVNSQGQGMLLNWMKGTSANAGAGIASSLSGQMQTLANAFFQAISPEIIRREGANNHSSMVALAKRSTKLGMFFIMLVALPLFCECEYVLKLWLVTPPPYAVFFTRTAILSSMFYKMAVGHRICFQAIGKIRTQQIVELVVFASTVPVIGIVYLASRSVFVAFSFAPIMQFVYFIATITAGSYLYEWKIGTVLRDVFLKVSVCFVGGLFVFCGVSMILHEQSLARIMISTSALCIYVISFFLLFFFTATDRETLKGIIRKLVVGIARR